eukprot:586489-Pyramimonas_sp.AAC.1
MGATLGAQLSDPSQGLGATRNQPGRLSPNLRPEFGTRKCAGPPGPPEPLAFLGAGSTAAVWKRPKGRPNQESPSLGHLVRSNLRGHPPEVYLFDSIPFSGAHPVPGRRSSNWAPPTRRGHNDRLGSLGIAKLPHLVSLAKEPQIPRRLQIKGPADSTPSSLALESPVEARTVKKSRAFVLGLALEVTVALAVSSRPAPPPPKVFEDHIRELDEVPTLRARRLYN